MGQSGEKANSCPGNDARKGTQGNWAIGGSGISLEGMVGCPDWLVGLLVCLKKKKSGVGGLERQLGADMCVIHN